MLFVQFKKQDMFSSSALDPAPETSGIGSAKKVFATRENQKVPGTVIAGSTVLIAVLALIVGILQLRNERQKRRTARELEHELMELEVEILEVHLF